MSRLPAGNLDSASSARAEIGARDDREQHADDPETQDRWPDRLIVTGAVAGVLALAAPALGAGALWADGEKNDQGTGDRQRALRRGTLRWPLRPPRRPGWRRLARRLGELGKVQLEVAPRGRAGLRRTRAHGGRHVLSARCGPHARDRRGRRSVRGLVPARVRQRPAGGPRSGVVLGRLDTGSRHRDLDWRVDDGDWSVVVTIADGSRGVAADVSGGARCRSWMSWAGARSAAAAHC